MMTNSRMQRAMLDAREKFRGMYTAFLRDHYHEAAQMRDMERMPEETNGDQDQPEGEYSA